MSRRISQSVVGLALVMLALAVRCDEGVYAFATEAEVAATRAAFVAHMGARHDFTSDEVEQALANAQVSAEILRLISTPAERTEPWYTYRRRVSVSRIEKGIAFAQTHAEALASAEKTYGVPPEVVTAILGLETNYGAYPLRHRVIDALVTLAFYYPPRAETFLPQLEDFLVLVNEEQVPITEIKGSYAGAMGVPQFMPTSYRTWAVDFNGDGARDIWTSMDDVVGSVAAYLAAHGWVRGGALVVPVSLAESFARGTLTEGIRPGAPLADFWAAGVSPSASTDLPPGSAPAALLEMAGGPERMDYWLVLDNFYCITRYNHSAKYAMVITELAQAIADGLAVDLEAGGHAAQ